MVWYHSLVCSSNTQTTAGVRWPSAFHLPSSCQSFGGILTRTSDVVGLQFMARKVPVDVVVGDPFVLSDERMYHSLKVRLYLYQWYKKGFFK